MIRIKLADEEIQQRRQLLAQWSGFNNNRSPVIVFMDAPFYCKLAEMPIENIYKNPQNMVTAQLKGWKRLLENVDCDNDGPSVGIDFGSCFTGSIYGCNLIEQPGSVPTTKKWFESASDIDRLKEIDPFSSSFQKKANEYYNWMKEHSIDYPVSFIDGMQSYPLDSVELMTGSEGPFSILCMTAGIDRISIWCYENPDLVLEMMGIVTAKEIDRINKSFEYMNKQPDRIFLADDYSPYMPLDIYEKFILPFQIKLCAAFPQNPCFHSCIPDKRLLKYWKEHLRIELFNGFKPQNGLDNLKRDYRTVADLMSGSVLLEPDLDGANVMVADGKVLEQAAEDFLEIFDTPAGVKLCYTLTGGHSTKDMNKCNVVKRKLITF